MGLVLLCSFLIVGHVPSCCGDDDGTCPVLWLLDSDELLMCDECWVRVLWLRARVGVQHLIKQIELTIIVVGCVGGLGLR